MKKHNPKKLLIFAYFWRSGIIGLALLLPIISGLIFANVDCLFPYGGYAIWISFGIPLCAMGMDYILGCVFEFPHIILVYESFYHRKMDPYDLTWEFVSKKELIGVGGIFIFFGIVLILFPFVV